MFGASNVQTTLIIVRIRQPLVLSTDNASFKAKNIREGSPDLFMSVLRPLHSEPYHISGVRTRVQKVKMAQFEEL